MRFEPPQSQVILEEIQSLLDSPKCMEDWVAKIVYRRLPQLRMILAEQEGTPIPAAHEKWSDEVAALFYILKTMPVGFCLLIPDDGPSNRMVNWLKDNGRHGERQKCEHGYLVRRVA